MMASNQVHFIEKKGLLGILKVGYTEERCPSKVGCGFADTFTDVLVDVSGILTADVNHGQVQPHGTRRL